VGQWPLGFLSDRVDRRWVMAFAALVGTVVGVLIFLFYSQVSTLQLMLMSAAWGAVAFPVYAVAVANANDNAGPKEYVMVSSGLLLMYGLGAIAGPFLAPVLMHLAGPGGLYLFAACIHLILLGYILYRIKRRSHPSEEEHIPFADSLASTQTASHYYEEEL
jgi:MFS family permease